MSEIVVRTDEIQRISVEEEFDEERMRCYVMKSRNGKTRFVTGVSIDYNTLSMSELTTNDYSNDESN